MLKQKNCKNDCRTTSIFFFNRKFKIIVGVDSLMALSVYCLNVHNFISICLKHTNENHNLHRELYTKKL